MEKQIVINIRQKLSDRAKSLSDETIWEFWCKYNCVPSPDDFSDYDYITLKYLECFAEVRDAGKVEEK